MYSDPQKEKFLEFMNPPRNLKIKKKRQNSHRPKSMLGVYLNSSKETNRPKKPSSLFRSTDNTFLRSFQAKKENLRSRGSSKPITGINTYFKATKDSTSYCKSPKLPKEKKEREVPMTANSLNYRLKPKNDLALSSASEDLEKLAFNLTQNAFSNMRIEPSNSTIQKKIYNMSERGKLYGFKRGRQSNQTKTIEDRPKRKGSYFRKRRRIKKLTSERIQWPNELKSPKEYKGFYWSPNLEFCGFCKESEIGAKFEL